MTKDAHDFTIQGSGKRGDPFTVTLASSVPADTAMEIAPEVIHFFGHWLQYRMTENLEAALCLPEEEMWKERPAAEFECFVKGIEGAYELLKMDFIKHFMESFKRE